MESKEQFMENVKQAMDLMKENSLNGILETDDHYKNIKKAAAEAEAAYMNMHLSEEQKSVLDRFIDYRSKEDYEYALLSYMAGMLDGIRIHKLFEQ